jgi:catechol 2,3-dioxygenase-like lactoylglutathione lyase family enzyme
MSMELSELAFFTDNVSKMTEFYQKFLGKAPDYSSQTMTMFTLGGVTLLIHARYTPAAAELPPDNHFAFKVGDVDSVSRQLLEKGLSLEHPPRDYDWGRSAYLRDPDGQLIELAQDEG